MSVGSAVGSDELVIVGRNVGLIDGVYDGGFVVGGGTVYTGAK